VSGGSWRLAALLLAVAACRPSTAAERRTVQGWLLCEECSDGELDSVIAMGDRAVPLLRDALQGPPASRRDNMRQQARAMYEMIPDTTVISAQRYLDRYAENYVASYQSRAAVALGRIGTRKARTTLAAALRRDAVYRSDVRRALGGAMRAVLTLVAGDGQHAPADSFVKVDPLVRVRDSATGAGLKGVPVRFFVDSGGGVADSVRITDDSGRATVRWRLGADPDDSLNLLRIVAAGRGVRVRATAHPDTLRVVILTQPAGGTAGLPIIPTVRLGVVDAWGAIRTNLNQPVTVTVVGTQIVANYPLVGGVAQLTGLSVPVPATGLTLKAQTSGATVAESDSFEVAP